MSKLAEQIKAVQTNERHAQRSPVINIVAGSSEIPPLGSRAEHYRYELTATFGCTAIMEFGTPSVQGILKEVRRQVLDEVFGEFRQNFNEIERALFDYDNEAARKALQSFRQRMFEV